MLDEQKWLWEQLEEAKHSCKAAEKSEKEIREKLAENEKERVDTQSQIASLTAEKNKLTDTLQNV